MKRFTALDIVYLVILAGVGTLSVVLPGERALVQRDGDRCDSGLVDRGVPRAPGPQATRGAAGHLARPWRRRPSGHTPCDVMGLPRGMSIDLIEENTGDT